MENLDTATLDKAYLKAVSQTLDEWDSDEDNEAYQLIP